MDTQTTIPDEGYSATASRTYYTEGAAAALIAIRFVNAPISKSVRNVTTGIGVFLLLQKYIR
jgi:hypothetical protein